MEMLVTGLKGTPWWVYLFFIYLVWQGIEARKSRIVTIKKMFIIPVVFLLWGISGIFIKFAGFSDILYWIVFLIVGWMLGWRVTLPKLIRADRKKLLIKTPATNLILVLALVFFVVKYGFGYYYQMHEFIPALVRFFDMAISGLISGFFLGRGFCYLKKFSKAHHENLKIRKSR